MAESFGQTGLGLCISAGFQREIWKDRLRYNPGFSFGNYSTQYFEDSRDMYFNTINIQNNLYLDLVRIKSVSLLAGTGLFIDYSAGLAGTGGDSDQPALFSEYKNDLFVGAYIASGFRYNNPNSRIAVELLPVNVLVGNKEFIEFNLRIGIDVKF